MHTQFALAPGRPGRRSSASRKGFSQAVVSCGPVGMPRLVRLFGTNSGSVSPNGMIAAPATSILERSCGEKNMDDDERRQEKRRTDQGR